MKAYILVKKEPLQKRKPIAFRYPANGSRRRPACLYLFIGLFLAACAQIAAPQGGSKDETAPLLLDATPASGSVNVTTSKVILEFDEFIALDDVFNQVLLSPPMSSIPDLVVKGKSIIMISSELPEILRMSDRVAVMCAGRLTGIIDNKDANQEVIIEYATKFSDNSVVAH